MPAPDVAPTTLSLYAPVASGAAVVLLGQRCACGRVAFPRQPYGCERCGRVEGRAEIELDGRGTLLAVAQAYVQLNQVPAVPFAVGAVRLLDGPVVRGFVGADLAPGARVVATDGREAGGSPDHDRLLFVPTAIEGRPHD